MSQPNVGRDAIKSMDLPRPAAKEIYFFCFNPDKLMVSPVLLSDLIKKRKIVTLEVLPPLDGNAGALSDEIKPLAPLLDAVNLPSNPLGKLRTDSLCFGHILQEKLELPAIPHFVARHYTLLSFESQLLGCRALDIRHILCVTGDAPASGRSIFELNSAKLLRIGSALKQGLTSTRCTINPLPLCLATSFNPNVPNIYGEFIKAAEKSRNGAEFFFTQPVFDPDRFTAIIQEFRGRFHGAKVIAGLSFLHSKKRAFALMKFLGIPYSYINRLEENDETSMLFEIAHRINPFVDGFYVIPIAKYRSAVPLLENLKELIQKQ